MTAAEMMKVNLHPKMTQLCWHI